MGVNGPLKEIETCGGECPNTHALDCKIGEWSKWSSCSMSCGGGQSSRHRIIMQEPRFGGKSCDSSELVAVKACNEQDCFQHQYCTWAPWASWSSCSASCGNGVTKRSREMGATSFVPPVMMLNDATVGLNIEYPSEHFFSIFGMVSMCALAVAGVYRTQRFVRRRAAAHPYDEVDMGLELLPPNYEQE